MIISKHAIISFFMHNHTKGWNEERYRCLPVIESAPIEAVTDGACFVDPGLLDEFATMVDSN